MERTRLTWLLLTLSCLVHCVRADDHTATPMTTKPATTKALTLGVTPAPSTAASLSLATVRVSTTITSLTPVITEKRTTRVPTTIASHTVASTNPPTTAKRTIPPSVAATEKPATPSTGGSPVITSVLKESPTPTVPKSSSHSHPPTVGASVMGPTLPQISAITTKHTLVPTIPSKTGASVSVPQNPGDTATTKATNVSVSATTVKGTASIDTTTKHDAKATGTPSVVTSKSSPDQNLGLTGSTAPPTIPHSAESTSEPSTAVTGGKSGLDLVSASTTKSRETTEPQTTASSTTIPTATTAAPMPQKFFYSLNKGHQSEGEKDLVSLCQRLMGSLEDGNCTITFRHRNGTVLFDSVEIIGKVKTTIVTQQHEDITKKPTDNRTLITILASCGALLIMIIILAVCASHHRKPYSENQQHLTEELQTVENGYHDNPTLEVMEVGADMQVKKPPLSLNNGGEFNDSWIVPIDNLLKEEGPDEEDTHL